VVPVDGKERERERERVNFSSRIARLQFTARQLEWRALVWLLVLCRYEANRKDTKPTVVLV
jgi:hypothetical protein